MIAADRRESLDRAGAALFWTVMIGPVYHALSGRGAPAAHAVADREGRLGDARSRRRRCPAVGMYQPKSSGPWQAEAERPE